MEDTNKSYTGWAIVELMGHRRLGGHVSEAVQFGAAMLRIDIPHADPRTPGFAATQFYGGASIYAITPVAETSARAVAANNQPQPVAHWELPHLPSPTGVSHDDDDHDDDDHDDAEPE